MRARRVRKVLSAIAAMALSGNAMAAVFTAPYGPGGTYNLYQPVFAGATYKDAANIAASTLDPLGNGLLGHLVTLHSVAENNFAHSIAGGGDVWIGLTDRVGAAPGAFESQGTANNLTMGWAWVTGEPFTFQNWGGGEPNDFNGAEDAAHLRGDTLWNDNGSGYGLNDPVADPLSPAEGAPVFKYVIEWETNSPTPVAGAQLGGMPNLGALPGTQGGVMQWGVREVYANGQLDNLQQAIDSIASGGGVIVNGTAPVINHSDPESRGGQGLFTPDLNFIGETPGVDNDDFAVIYKGKIRIENSGDYTFNVRSDDGFGLRINGATFTAIAGTGNAQIDPLDSSVVTHTAVTGDANTRAVANLAAGDYDVEFIFFERAGGAFVELSAAEGSHLAGGESNFRPIGYKDSGIPTYKPGIAGDNWTVTTSPVGGNLLNNFTDFLADITAGPNTVVMGVDTINYTDPQTNAGDPGSPFGAHRPFDNDTGADDNDFGIFATATLVIPYDGAYEFGFRGDDGGFIRIVGQPWDSVLVNGTGATVIANIFGTGNDTLWCDCLTGDSNSVGKIFLAAGVYTIETGMFERGGGAWYEVFARGNGGFGLLGGPAMLMPDFDGIQLVPLPAAAWMGLALMGGLGAARRRKA